MKFQLRKVCVSTPTTNQNWGGCFVEQGLIVLLEIASDSSVQASHLGKSVFERIFQKFGSVPEKDKNAVKALLSEISKNPYLKTAIIGIVSDSELYLGCLGKGQAVLIRGQTFGPVVSGGFVSQGQIVHGDRLIFHSDSLARVLEGKDLEKFYLLSDLDEFEESLAGVLSNEKKVAHCAVLAIHFVKGQNFSIEKAAKISISGKFLYSEIIKKLSVYLSGKTLRQKIFLLSLLILILFLVINSSAGYFKTKNSQKAKQFNQSLELVINNYNEAQNLIDLNPVRSRELLAGSKLTVSQMLSSFKKNSKEYKTLSSWFEKISQLEVSAYKIYKLTAVPVFFDISLIKPEGFGSKISVYQSKKVILDMENKALYYLDTSSKESAILAGSDTVKNAKTASVHGNNAYLLNEDGIYAIDIAKKSAQISISKDDGWGEIVALNAFAGNLYLLDKTNSIIWKYVATENGFSEKRRYINQGVPANFAKIDNMAIDGSIWLTGDDQIIKYTQGNLGQFSFQGFSDGNFQIDAISTSDSEKNIYLLDRSLKRIVVFDKDGLYVSQYQWEDLKNARSIVASESEGKIFVLKDSLIYAIDIK